MEQSRQTALPPSGAQMGAVQRLQAMRVVKLKDSCYSALGLAASYLGESFDYNRWLAGTLAPEMRYCPVLLPAQTWAAQHVGARSLTLYSNGAACWR